MTLKRSGRILLDAAGKEQHVEYDETDKASVERAHGYDTKPGALFNAILKLAQPARDAVLALAQAERERVMGLEAKLRDEAIAALLEPEKSKTVPEKSPPISGATKGSSL